VGVQSTPNLVACGTVSFNGRSADAAALLQPVYDRFTEGFTTADLRAAKALLDDLP
jgi:predicted ATPase